MILNIHIMRKNRIRRKIRPPSESYPSPMSVGKDSAIKDFPEIMSSPLAPLCLLLAIWMATANSLRPEFKGNLIAVRILSNGPSNYFRAILQSTSKRKARKTNRIDWLPFSRLRGAGEEGSVENEGEVLEREYASEKENGQHSVNHNSTKLQNAFDTASTTRTQCQMPHSTPASHARDDSPNFCKCSVSCRHSAWF